jgi:hypothetical protein
MESSCWLSGPDRVATDPVCDFAVRHWLRVIVSSPIRQYGEGRSPVTPARLGFSRRVRRRESSKKSYLLGGPRLSRVAVGLRGEACW